MNEWIITLIYNINLMMADLNGRSLPEMEMLIFFKYYGWVIFVYVFLVYAAWPEYIDYIQIRWTKKKVKYMFLAIDVPKNNEQSVQAMENFFDHLQGAHGSINKWEKYVVGVYQLGFSCELVSLEGNVQFVIRTPIQFRNLVEAALYAQYPDAEITEVNDYTGTVPRIYPNETHDLWGVEFSLSDDDIQMLKTYPKFEHRFSETFVDPMAALLETMSMIGPGEQIWLQILLKPEPFDWGKKRGKEAVYKMLEKTLPAPKKGLLAKISEPAWGILKEVIDSLIGFGGPPAAPEKPPFKLMPNLTPGEKERIEDIERKISKWAFKAKYRFVYVAEKEKMNKALAVNGVVGAIKQWTDVNSNGLRPMMKETAVSGPNYVFIERRRNARKNYILWAYRGRDPMAGMPAKYLCSEELASLWHFPGMFMKAPLVKKTDFTKVSAPVSLPYQGIFEPESGARKVKEKVVEKNAAMPTFDYDNEEFEKQFAIDKNETRLRSDFLADEQPEKPPAAPQMPVNQTETIKKPNIPFIDFE